MRLLTVAVLAVVLALSSAQNAFAAQASLNPTHGPPGTKAFFSGSGFVEPSFCEHAFHSIPDGLSAGYDECQETGGGGNGVISGSFTVAAGAKPGLYLVDFVGEASAEFTVGTGAIEVPYSICVLSLGVEQSDGVILWLPGYAYPGTPVSQCQNKTDLLGQDVLNRTIMIHQFILNGTYLVPETLPPIIVQ
jgi:hypothetical protein